MNCFLSFRYKRRFSLVIAVLLQSLSRIMFILNFYQVQAPVGAIKDVRELAGKRIVTSFPKLAKEFFAKYDKTGDDTDIKSVITTIAACLSRVGTHAYLPHAYTHTHTHTLSLSLFIYPSISFDLSIYSRHRIRARTEISFHNRTLGMCRDRWKSRARSVWLTGLWTSLRLEQPCALQAWR